MVNQIMNNIVEYLKWISLVSAYFAIFYFIIITPIAILSGLNLNYMLHPPPDQDVLVGQSYRMISNVCCLIGFTGMRLFIMMMELIFKRGYGIRVTSSDASDLKKKKV